MDFSYEDEVKRDTAESNTADSHTCCDKKSKCIKKGSLMIGGFVFLLLLILFVHNLDDKNAIKAKKAAQGQRQGKGEVAVPVSLAKRVVQQQRMSPVAFKQIY